MLCYHEENWLKECPVEFKPHLYLLQSLESALLFRECMSFKDQNLKFKVKHEKLGSFFTAWKVSKYGVFPGPYFPVFELNTEIYGPEKPPYLDTSHPVFFLDVKFVVNVITFFTSISEKPILSRVFLNYRMLQYLYH